MTLRILVCVLVFVAGCSNERVGTPDSTVVSASENRASQEVASSGETVTEGTPMSVASPADDDVSSTSSRPNSPSPTMSTAGGECQLGVVQTVATLEAELSAVSLVLDETGGVAVWVAQQGELTLQPLSANSSPRGTPQTVAIERAREILAVHRHDQGFRVFALAGAQLFAIDVDAEGRVIGEPRQGRIVACRPALEGLFSVIAPRALRVDESRHAAYRVHWHGDELYLICLNYRQMEFRRVEVTANAVEVSEREIGRTGNVKEANVLAYWWLTDGEQWAMLSWLYDEDWRDDSQRSGPFGYRLRAPGWAPNPGMRSIGALTELPGTLRGQVRAARLADHAIELVVENRRGDFHLWRVSFAGESLSEPGEIDPTNITAPFDEHLTVSFEVEDGRLCLIRQDALGRNLGEQPIELGAITVRRAHGLRIAPPVDWRWTGRQLAFLWVERSDSSTIVQSRLASCPR